MAAEKQEESHRRIGRGKSNGLLSGTTTVKRWLHWISIFFAKRSVQQRSGPTSISDARLRKRRWCFDRPYWKRYFIVGSRQQRRLLAAMNRFKRWELAQIESKIKMWHKFDTTPCLSLLIILYVLLCFLSFSVLFWVFVRREFPENPKPKNPGKLLYDATRMWWLWL